MTTYLYRNRPPSIGCQPDGFTSREVWMPGHPHPSGGPHRCFLGQVEYPTPLSFKQVKRYDLWPVCEVERAEMVFWLEGDSDDRLREDYLGQSVELLAEYALRGDQKARAALILRNL